MAEGTTAAATPGALAVARSADAFGASLHLLLAAGGGTVFSPASVAAALRLALLGARGRTAGELATALHLAAPGDAGGELPGPAVGPAGLIGLPGPGVIVHAPAVLWVQAGLPLLASFAATAGRMEGATVAAADFAHSAEAARREVNAAIAGQTGGKVADLLPPGAVSALTRLLLTSAVYLKAAWAEPFPPGGTRDAPFHPAEGGEVAVAMMALQARLAYLRGDGYQAVSVPYQGHRLGMAVLLPDGPLAALEQRLAAGGVMGLLAGASQQWVRLRLPKFRQETGLDLVPALRRLGIGEAFGERADFSGITTDAAGLRVGHVVHRAFIEVDERGTEAAAATATVMRAAAFVRPAGPVIEMTVDRPFLFAITDTATGLPLFLGRVTLPAAGPGAAGGAEASLRR